MLWKANVDADAFDADALDAFNDVASLEVLLLEANAAGDIDAKRHNFNMQFIFILML